jgi:hypothetical protein
MDFHIVAFDFFNFEVSNNALFVGNNKVITVRGPFHGCGLSSWLFGRSVRFIDKTNLFFGIIVPKCKIALCSCDCKISFLGMGRNTLDFSNN